MLYPLKFKPILKDRLWGGVNLEKKYAKKNPEKLRLGESWELSGIEGDQSVVCEGMLEGNSIGELIEVYMGDLVGDSVFERFGEELPLLIKLIDTQDLLSIQVHPNDSLSATRHGAYGKTEMWYVLDHEPGAFIYLGFNRKVDREQYLNYLKDGRLEELLAKYTVSKGDIYFVPSGVVHAIGRGVTVAEIQQTSDVTYRIYDFDRVDINGFPRELHTDLALDAIDFSLSNDLFVKVEPVSNGVVPMQSCSYFESVLTNVDGAVERLYGGLDSFVVYLCLEGEVSLSCDNGSVAVIKKGETLLIPALVDQIRLEGCGRLIETWIPPAAIDSAEHETAI